MSDNDNNSAARQIGDRLFELGEGATYDPASETAWWFDIVGRKLVEYAVTDDSVTVHDLPMMASALAFIDDDRQMILSEDGLCVRDIKSGTLARYLDIESDNDVTRSNDARVHPCGAFWVSTMGKKGEDGAGAIYHVFKGKLTRLYDRVSVPNAICFSADGATGYFTDTRKSEVMRVSLDPATGEPEGDPTVFLAKDASPGKPDGAIIDADGNFWNARHGAGTLDVFSPDGNRIRSFSVPATQVTCPAFLGRNADRVILTTAYEKLDRETRAAQPLAGATFLIDVPVDGRLDPRIVL